MAGPDLWFSVAVAGVLVLYWEFVRPGLIIPAALGLLLLLTGIYRLAVLNPNFQGVACIILAGALFTIESQVNTRLVGSVSGTVSLAAGSLLLYSGSKQIDAWIALTGACLIGPLTALLVVRIRTARANKRADL